MGSAPALRLLLDTHALLWALTDNHRLSARAASLIGDPENAVLLSAASAYEICAKHTLGKLPQAAGLAADFNAVIAPLDVQWLPVAASHAIVAGKLDMSHRDPFDRLLIAQALVEQVPLVSNEALFDRFGVQRLW